MAGNNGSTPQVTILGAGIVGVCCALSALERGLSVTIVDRLGPGEATSYGNAGVISPWSCVPQCMPGVWKSVPGWLLDPAGPVKLNWRDLHRVLPWAARFLRNATPERVERIADAMDVLMRGNVDAYRRHLDGTGREDLLLDSWYVNVFRGPARPDLRELAWKLRIDRGAPLEIVGAAELREIEPAVSHDYTAAVLIKDQARARSPGELCRALAEKAFRHGAEMRSAEVLALEPQPDGTVSLRTADGLVPTRRLVLAAGIWSARLLEPLGLRLPLMAERGYHIEFDEPGIVVNNSIQDMSAKVVISSMTGGVRCAGTAEFASPEAPPNMDRARRLAPLAKRLLPGLDTSRPKEWMGMRPSFPDNLPAIGPLPGLPSVLAAFGHSHYGLGMAPATGRLIADLLSGRRGNSDVEAFSPERFLRPKAGDRSRALGHAAQGSPAE